MSSDINLLPHKKTARFSEEQVLAATKVLAITSCILTVSLSLVFFLLNRDPSLAQIQAQQQTILTQLNLLHSKTAKDLIILDRLKRITKITQNRKAMEKKIATIQKELPSGVTVSSFSLDDKLLTMTISAQSLSPLGAFVESMTQHIQNKELFKKLTIQGVISDEKTGNFLLSITCDVL